MSATQAGNEMTKTLLFVGAAVISLAVGFATRPTKYQADPADQAGKLLFPDFTDVGNANGLEVLSYNEELGELKNFRVAQQDKGIWSLPSKQDYPADAEDRLVNASTMFVGLKAIAVVSELDGEHATYGVVEPNAEKTSLGDEGVGTLVTVFGKDKSDAQTKLASLVIGKAVKGMDGQHYVRRPGKSRVYQVEIDPTQLSTKFKDWIETDLLKLNTWDIADLTLKDYSVETQQTLQGLAITNYDQRLEVTVSEKNGSWNLDLLKEFSDGDLRPSDLEEGEELNTERLNTLKNALGELKIVDVERKPKGLGADLKADKGFLNDQEGIVSLARRGFYPVPQQDGTTELWSSDGELLVDTKEGVRYVLRFGQIASMSTEEGGDDEAADAAADTESDSSAGVNRFMFVSVQVNEDQFPEPELEALPEAAAKGDADDSEAESTEGDSDDADSTDADSDEASSEENGDEAGTEEAEEEATDEDELAVEIERIKKENQRKIDERNDKIETAKKKVNELTYRFADWYYIVDDSVFKKLRLRREEVISFSEEALKNGTGLGAFRNLQEEGLQPVEEEKPAPLGSGGPPPGFGGN